MAATPPDSIARTKSVRCSNGVSSVPQSPRRCAYARPASVVAPVAETYSTRASGSAFCNRSPARPCRDGATSPRLPFEPAALAMAWASSKTITPENEWRACSSSPPASHSTICFRRDCRPWRAGDLSVA